MGVRVFHAYGFSNAECFFSSETLVLSYSCMVSSHENVKESE